MVGRIPEDSVLRKHYRAELVLRRDTKVEVTVDDTREVGLLGDKQIWFKISAAEDSISGWVYAPHLVPVDRLVIGADNRRLICS
jgi:hypothetical protein